MNLGSVATSQRSRQATHPRSSHHDRVRIALLGTGTVGSALLERWARTIDPSLRAAGDWVHVADSRHRYRCDAPSWRWHATSQPASLDDVAMRLGECGLRIVLDASASEVLAERHADWLSAGIHVVTACKLGQGTELTRWQRIQEARQRSGARYGDSATVGAGLPLLSSLRALREGGDRIHAIAGVLSGSMAWLFHQFDGLRPFSGFVRQARAHGYTEPDPREDLSGEDVRRKLLILARASGFALPADAVQVNSLVPPSLARLPKESVDEGLELLDSGLRERYAGAYKRGEKLRFIARLQEGQARVGLESLAADHPLAGGGGSDNRVAIWSDRYSERPLVIQGPGAGAQVTAAAMLDDLRRIVRECSGNPLSTR